VLGDDCPLGKVGARNPALAEAPGACKGPAVPNRFQCMSGPPGGRTARARNAAAAPVRHCPGPSNRQTPPMRRLTAEDAKRGPKCLSSSAIVGHFGHVNAPCRSERIAKN
jgi:hypothetical protein